MKIGPKVKRFVDLKKGIPKLEKECSQLSLEIAEWCDNNKTDRAGDPESGVWVKRPPDKLYASYSQENAKAVHAWLRENGHGGILKMGAHPATLSAICREHLENGGVLPDCISTYLKPSITYNAAGYTPEELEV